MFTQGRTKSTNLRLVRIKFEEGNTLVVEYSNNYFYITLNRNLV